MKVRDTPGAAGIPQFDAADVAALLAEIKRFAAQRVAVACARPEVPIGEATLAALTREAVELGIVPAVDAGSESALWALPEDAGAVAVSIGALRHVAQANPGTAFTWHRLALARAVACRAGFGLDADDALGPALATTGHYGLARNALGRWLNGNDTADDRALLADWLDRRSHETAIIAPPSWRVLVWPVWNGEAIGWQGVRREALAVEPCRAQHGLDELAAFRVQATADERGAIFGGGFDDARAAYRRLLKLDLLGLLAIGAGALARASTLATEYAAVRRQGGRVIAGHSAVQQLLGDIESACAQVEAMLASLTHPVDAIDLAQLAALRAVAHDWLCRGANAAVQVHGGIGYTREAGVEKILRDQNMLRLQSGGVREIPLLLAGLRGGAQ